MLKNIRSTPLIAATTLRGSVRSPTITSAPRSRSRCARASSRCTIARTCSPLPINISTTERLTPPTLPAAPVIKYMLGSVAGEPRRGSDQVTAFECGDTVVVDLQVVLVGHHLDERRRRRVLDDENRVPPRMLT